jgi:quinol-cytochrome oxidoreductase complex cytochrome b subunit
MVVNRLLKKLPNLFNFIIPSTAVATIIQFMRLVQYRHILQRTATLLAVAELTLCAIAAFTGILLAFYYQPTALEFIFIQARGLSK